jgi:hypothetical protein
MVDCDCTYREGQLGKAGRRCGCLSQASLVEEQAQQAGDERQQKESE